jgi:SpoIID/LytB domain protein
LPGGRAGGADICATDACQVYRGLARERQDHAPSWNAAVAATAGQVIVYRGWPIFAEYSDSNGGRTAAGDEPYLRAVADPDDAVAPLHHWQVAVPLSDLSRIFNTPAPVTGAARQGDVVVLGWAQPDGTTATAEVAVADFRSKLDSQEPPSAGMPETVPSARFSLSTDTTAGVAVIDGGGWGHGVGMSQYGALGKALRGMRAPDILAAYYAGLRPVATTPGQLPATIRVGLDDGRSVVAVTGNGRFRVLDGSGRPVAFATSGTWQVVPGPSPGTVRVLGPPDQVVPPGLAVAGVEPANPVSGAPLRLRYHLVVPSAIRLGVRGPGMQPTQIDAGVVDQGDSVAELPAAGAPGDYEVSVQADAGGGRVATVPVVLSVSAPGPSASRGADASAHRSRRDLSGHLQLASGAGGAELGRGPRGGRGALAGLALLLVAAAAWRTFVCVRRTNMSSA